MKDRSRFLITFFSIHLLFFVIVLLTIFFFIEIISLLYPFILFTLSGIVLTILSVKWVKGKKLRTWLIINGLSATALIIFAVLHNLFYALNTVVDNALLSKAISILEGGSFLISIPLSPILFVVSTVFVIVLWLKKS